MTDKNGQPIPETTVCARQLGVVRREPPCARTDDAGRFRLLAAEPGKNTLESANAARLLPDTSWGLFALDEQNAVVDVRPGDETRGVEIRREHPGAVLRGDIIDFTDDVPVLNAQIKLRSTEQPKLWLSMSSGAHFHLVVPAHPLRVEISAPGYEPWSLPFVTLRPTATETLRVQLKRFPKP